jgi:hypothetical protein
MSPVVLKEATNWFLRSVLFPGIVAGQGFDSVFAVYLKGLALELFLLVGLQLIVVGLRCLKAEVRLRSLVWLGWSMSLIALVRAPIELQG